MDDGEICCQRQNQTYNSYLNNLSIAQHTRVFKKKIQKQKSEMVDAYREIMDQFQIPQLNQFQQNLKSHDIIIKTALQQKNNIWNKECIGQINTSSNWKILNIKVIIGRFSIELEICNMSIKKLSDDLMDETNKDKMQNKDFKGTFGVVLPWYYQGKYYATKLLQFNSQETSDLSILNTIFQYAYNKLLSALKVGPKTSKIRGFDLIIYEDCIQFDMQLCSSIAELKRKGQFKKNLSKQKQVYSSLKLMHKYNIIHHDIKPANIMYSNQYKKFVFIDFGFTKSVDSVLGEKQITLFVGTFNYTSPQMKRTVVQSDVSVDLYWNDLYGLRLSLQQIFHSCKETSYLMYNAFCYNQEESMASAQYVYFFLIIDILRNNGDDADIQEIVKLIGKQIIQQNYHFFVDFFISITPKKSIGFFCQRYLKHMIANDIKVRQKIDVLYEKGWPRMIFIPEILETQYYEKRFSFYSKQSQKQGFITGFRNIKLMRKNKTQIQKQLVQYAKGFHDVYENHYEFFSILLVYFTREESSQKRQSFAKQILQIVFPQELKIKNSQKSSSAFAVLQCIKYIDQNMIFSWKQGSKNHSLSKSRSTIVSRSSSSSGRSSKSRSPPLVQTVQNEINYEKNLLSPQKKQKRLEQQSRAKSKMETDKTIRQEKSSQNNQIDNNQYKNYLYRACGYLIQESENEQAVNLINYLVKQVRSTDNLIKIYEFGVIANQNLQNFSQSAFYLKKWNKFFPFAIEENLNKLQGSQFFDQIIIPHDNKKETNLQEVTKYDNLNQSMKETSCHLKYWILRYLRLLAYQAMFQINTKKVYLYIEYCYKLLRQYQKEIFFKQFCASLLLLEAKIKFHQQQVQESLKLALQSNQYSPCTKKINSALAIFISNLYCIIGDQKMARNYFDVVKKNIGQQKLLNDQKILILSGQINLLQFNIKEAQQNFKNVLDISPNIQRRMSRLMSFAAQFKGIQCHLFLFKYLQQAEILLHQNQSTFTEEKIIQLRLKIIQVKLLFYRCLTQTQEGPKIMMQCEISFKVCKKYIQARQLFYNESQTQPPFQFDKLKQVYLKNITKYHLSRSECVVSLEYIYQLKGLLIKNFNRQDNKSKKQYIDCYAKIVQILLIQGKDHTDPQMKQEMQYSIECHLNHQDMIYCFNSDYYTLMTLKYLQYNRRYQKLVDVFIQICLFFTKYRNKRNQKTYKTICSQVNIQEEHNSRVIKYFSEVSDEIMNEGSQILLFIYCIYLKQKDINYRLISQKLIIKHISFLATSTKSIIMGKFFKQIIKDLQQSNKITQNKERMYLKRHLKCSNMISQAANNQMQKKIIKMKKSQNTSCLFLQKYRQKMKKIYLSNNQIT